jgi:hypothetical protein
MPATSPPTTARRIRTLTLRGRKWKVRWLDRVYDAATGRELYGQCDHAASTISFSLNQPLSEVEDTLIHEVCHAIFPRVKEKHVRSGATELLAALRHAGLCPRRKRHETGHRAETPGPLETRNERLEADG